jgi:hypothetical protein
MDLLSLHFSPLLCGAGFFALFTVWRKSASRWSTWFPLLKKTLEWLLIGVAVALALWAAGILLGAGAHLPTYALAFAAGLAAPHFLLGSKLGKAEKEETTRGSTLAPAADVAKKVRASKAPTQLSLGGVPIPVSAEPYHFLFSGATGTGKSVGIGALLEALRARGDTAILVDSGGDFLSKHYNADTDFVFNPYDDRCIGWSPTAEMQGAWDATAMARSIVPDGTGEAKEWNGYAQTFVASVLRKLWETNRLTLKDFLYYVQAASIPELTELLAGTAAASQLAADKTFGSIRTIAGNYVAAYDYLPTDQETFSVAEMIRAEHSGVLFVTYRDDQLDSLRNLIACLLDVAARTILSLNPDPNRRIWLIIDEFASIGKVQSIEAVATKARKAGGCLVLGIQSVSQLKDRYGEHGAQTILSCLSTWLVLRCSDADTAEYMSKYIGEAEVKRTQQGTSTSDSGDSQSWNEQSATQRVVLGSQIQAFANLTGLLKLAGDFPVCSVKLPLPKNRESVHTAFKPRDFRARPLLALSAPPAPAAAAPVAAEAAAPAPSPAPAAAPARPAEPRPAQGTPAARAQERPVKEPVVPAAVPSAFSSARNVGKALPMPPSPPVAADVTPDGSDVEQFEHQLRDTEQAETAVAAAPAQPVQDAAKTKGQSTKKRGPKARVEFDPNAPQIETLSSRRRRASANANGAAREAQEPTRAPEPVRAPEARADAAPARGGSARELRDLLR